jgi:hypothetical protein
VKRLWPGQPIRIGAQRYLEAFYGSLGFVPKSERKKPRRKAKPPALPVTENAA